MSNTPRIVGSMAVGLCLFVLTSDLRADVVLDWNDTLCTVVQSDGTRPVNMANPGWSTRAMAMTNGAIYDVFQATNRTHQPFMVDTTALPETSRDAAVHQAAYQILRSAYPAESALLDAAYTTRMSGIGEGTAKSNGISLGNSIAQAYIAARGGDHSADMYSYTPGTGPGEWRPDPFNPDQQAWGPGWGTVTPFVIPSTDPFVAALPGIPTLTSDAYTEAFNQVKTYGAVDSAIRSEAQDDIALFWAYDRAGMGPPPVLFMRNVTEVAEQAGNTAEENARLLAMASSAMADAAISAWDAKFSFNFWRPVTAIHDAETDGNPNTAEDNAWRPMGAPGDDPNSVNDDFTPPFPAWTSGHATMGGAAFKTLELFYGTNDFDAIDGVMGNDPTYMLTSLEFDGHGDSGMSREYTRFTQLGELDLGLENSPEGENGTSRVYLGIHWIFDQRDGIQLGNTIAAYTSANRFQPVPEPGSWLLVAIGLVTAYGRKRR